MVQQKKIHDFRGRHTPKASIKVQEFMQTSGNGMNRETELLAIDGIAARDFLSAKILEDNRKKYLG